MPNTLWYSPGKPSWWCYLHIVEGWWTQCKAVEGKGEAAVQEGRRSGSAVLTFTSMQIHCSHLKSHSGTFSSGIAKCTLFSVQLEASVEQFRSHKCRGSIWMRQHLNPLPHSLPTKVVLDVLAGQYHSLFQALTLCGEKMFNMSCTLQSPWHESLSWFSGLRISLAFVLCVLTITLLSQKVLKKSLHSPQIRVGTVTTHSFSRLELDVLLEMEMETSWSLGHSQFYHTESLPGHILLRSRTVLSCDAPAGLW